MPATTYILDFTPIAQHINPAAIYELNPEPDLFEINKQLSRKDVKLAEMAQYRGLLDAYTFIQKTVLPQMENGASPVMLVSWLDTINGFIAKPQAKANSEFLNCPQLQAGKYNQDLSLRFQHGPKLEALLRQHVENKQTYGLMYTAQQLSVFDLAVATSKAFLELLDRIDKYPTTKIPAADRAVAESSPFTLIMYKLTAAYRQGDLSPAEKTLVETFVRPGFFPSQLAEEMKQFAADTLNKWQAILRRPTQPSEENMAMFLSGVMIQFSQISPYYLANKRTAICLANILLLSIEGSSLVLYSSDKQATPMESLFRDQALLKKFICTELKDIRKGHFIFKQSRQEYLMTCSMTAEILNNLQEKHPSVDFSKHYDDICTSIEQLPVDANRLKGNIKCEEDFLSFVETLIFTKLQSLQTELASTSVSQSSLTTTSFLNSIKTTDREHVVQHLNDLTKLTWKRQGTLDKLIVFYTFDTLESAQGMEKLMLTNKITTKTEFRKTCLICHEVDIGKLMGLRKLEQQAVAAPEEKGPVNTLLKIDYFATLPFDANIIYHAMFVTQQREQAPHDFNKLQQCSFLCQNTYNAYLYAQKTMLPMLSRDKIGDLRPKQVLGWFKALHIALAKHEDTIVPAGDYCESPSRDYWRQGNIALKLFLTGFNDLSSLRSEAMQQELRDLGVTVNTTHYEHLIKLARRIYASDKIRLKGGTDKATDAWVKLCIAYNTGLLKENERKIIQKLAVIFPTGIQQKMETFARVLVSEWQECSRTDINAIVDLACFAYHEFLKIHPYDNNNGKLATLLLNSILCSFGQKSILLRDAIENTDPQSPYSLAVDALIDGHIEPFKNLVKERLQKASAIAFNVDTDYTQIRASLYIAIAEMIERIKGKASTMGWTLALAPYYQAMVNHLPRYISEEPDSTLKDVKLLKLTLINLNYLFNKIDGMASYQQPSNEKGLLALMEAPTEENQPEFVVQCS